MIGVDIQEKKMISEACCYVLQPTALASFHVSANRTRLLYYEYVNIYDSSICLVKES